MPPHLHPRSTATSTLFAGTLLASFAVVAVPHIWPCPRPRKAYMDGDSEIIVDEQGRLMRRVRRVRQPVETTDGVGVGAGSGAVQSTPAELEEIRRARRLASESITGTGSSKRKKTLQEEAEILRALQAETEALEKENARRECPVPKPMGVLGRFLGFDRESEKGGAD